MNSNLNDFFTQSWTSIYAGLVLFVPKLFALFLLMIAGYVIALALHRLTCYLLTVIHFNRMMESFGISPVLHKIGQSEPHAFLARALFWIVWLTFFLTGLNVLGFETAKNLSSDLLKFVPQLIVAMSILIAGFASANFLWRAILLWAADRQFPQAQMLGRMVRWLVLVASFSMALEQLQIAQNIVHTAFAILFGGIVAALSIAFGLGGRHLAKHYLEEQFSNKAKPAVQEQPIKTDLHL